MWLTYPTDLPEGTASVLNVAVTTDAAAVQAALDRLVPDDVQLAVTTVPRTQARLREVSELMSAEPEFFERYGVSLYSAGTDLKQNAALVVVSQTSAVLETALRDRFGPGINIVEGDPIVQDTCTRTLGFDSNPPPPTSNCGPPWKGGLAMYVSGVTNPPKYCSSGFSARKWNAAAGEWLYVLWTSGHCGNHSWRQGSPTGGWIGATQSVYFSSGTGADIQTIPISEANASNYYLNTSASCANCAVFWVTAKEGHNTDEPGDPVCNHAAVTGNWCGYIEDTDASMPPYLGVSLIHMRKATYKRQGGDSGGPITLGASTAEGSHTHFQRIDGVDHAFFSQIWEIENASGFSVLLQ